MFENFDITTITLVTGWISAGLILLAYNSAEPRESMATMVFADITMVIYFLMMGLPGVATVAALSVVRNACGAWAPASVMRMICALSFLALAYYYIDRGQELVALALPIGAAFLRTLATWFRNTPNVYRGALLLAELIWTPFVFMGTDGMAIAMTVLSVGILGRLLISNPKRSTSILNQRAF